MKNLYIYIHQRTIKKENNYKKLVWINAKFRNLKIQIKMSKDISH